MTCSNDVINILIGTQMIVHKMQMNASTQITNAKFSWPIRCVFSILRHTMLFPFTFDRSRRSRLSVRSGIPSTLSFPFGSWLILAGHNISTLSSGVSQFVHADGLWATAPCPAKYMMITTSPGMILGSSLSSMNASMIADLFARSLRRLIIFSFGTPRSLRR